MTTYATQGQSNRPLTNTGGIAMCWFDVTLPGDYVAGDGFSVSLALQIAVVSGSPSGIFAQTRLSGVSLASGTWPTPAAGYHPITAGSWYDANSPSISWKPGLTVLPYVDAATYAQTVTDTILHTLTFDVPGTNMAAVQPPPFSGNDPTPVGGYVVANATISADFSLPAGTGVLIDGTFDGVHYGGSGPYSYTSGLFSVNEWISTNSFPIGGIAESSRQYAAGDTISIIILSTCGCTGGVIRPDIHSITTHIAGHDTTVPVTSLMVGWNTGRPAGLFGTPEQPISAFPGNGVTGDFYLFTPTPPPATQRVQGHVF